MLRVKILKAKDPFKLIRKTEPKQRSRQIENWASSTIELTNSKGYHVPKEPNSDNSFICLKQKNRWL